ncbi:PE-PPE domain-containing protein [Mycobacterium sp.]|uniref:PE-PPE domain-containing protein n=1 Tax=Mycobacterium sp. TaxID=1785 RepID=UPI0031DC6807
MFRPPSIAGVVIAAASLIAIPPVAPQSRDVRGQAVHLTSVDTADSALGDGTALMVGPSGIPIPPPRYLEFYDKLFLEPRGFAGAVESVYTPASLGGPENLPFDTSVALGQQIVDSAIQQHLAGVDAADPLVVTGWSQSSTIESLVMSQLHEQQVPSDDVHFVMVGDPNAPNGGLFVRFDIPVGGHSLIVSGQSAALSSPTPDDLYPTDIYTAEYDGFADYPRYPIDVLSDLNALLGIDFEHDAYLGFTHTQIADALQLPTTAADTLTNYYMIPSESLPLLDPLRLIPVVGLPLYDLLEPDTRILVDLGYGSLTEGWSQGPANVATSIGVFPANIDPTQLLTALANGAGQGVAAAVTQLENPDNYQVSLQSILDQPFASTLIRSGYATGELATLHPTLIQALEALAAGTAPLSLTDVVSQLTDGVKSLTDTITGDYAVLLSIADTLTTLLVNLPVDDAALFVEELQAGNLLDAIGLPVATTLGLGTFDIYQGIVLPILSIL